MPGRILSPGFFARPAPEVARDLLGAVLVSRVDGIEVSGRIVETEAYLGRDDPASHAFEGRRHAQNAGIYAPPGNWYVYRAYGLHWCANLVCAPPGLGSAVLIRAAVPLAGIATMAERRGRSANLADGPGKLCQALGITRALDGVPMVASDVVVRTGMPVPEELLHVTPRIGVTRAADWPLRFVIPRPPQDFVEALGQHPA